MTDPRATGATRYAEDVELDGMLHARIIRPRGQGAFDQLRRHSKRPQIGCDPHGPLSPLGMVGNVVLCVPAIVQHVPPDELCHHTGRYIGVIALGCELFPQFTACEIPTRQQRDRGLPDSLEIRSAIRLR